MREGELDLICRLLWSAKISRNGVHVAAKNTLTSSDSSDMTLLLAMLRGRDVACPVCQYNLRDLQQNRCPECGRLIELWIRTPENIYAAWITAVIASALSAPIGFVFVIALLTANMRLFESPSRAG